MFFGIDPGCSGAVSTLDKEGKPVGGSFKLSETMLDVVEYFEKFDLKDSYAVIEAVHSMPKQGVASTFTFGKSFGQCLGILSALRIPFILVSPVKWQTAMNCRTKGDKNVSKAAAQRLWPTVKISHANADSLLLAEYGRTILWK
jgi:hypothetical protein